MNDGMLSQDEIDALLKVSEEKDNTKEQENKDFRDEQEKRNEVGDYLSSIEIDTIGEIGNISFGSSATTLSMLLDQKVEITTPTISVVENDQLAEEFTFKPVSVQVDYTAGFSGRNVFIIKAKDASIIADIMLGGDGKTQEEDLSEIHTSAVEEAMNQMMGTAATSMSTVFNKKVDISPPSIIDGSIVKEVKEIFSEDVYVKVFFRLIVGDLIDSNMMQLIPITFAKELVNDLLHGSSEGDQEVAEEEYMKESISNGTESEPMANEDVSIQEISSNERDELNAPYAQENIKSSEPQHLGKKFDYGNTDIEAASFSTFEGPSLTSKEQRNLDMLMDISLNVTVELGRTRKSIKDILDLSSGSIVELDKLAGEPVDILVNGKLIAEGEVVVIEENFGVRVTDVISKSDRIMKLK